MHHYRSAWKSHSANFFVAVLASSAIFTAGCANMASTAAVSDSLPGTAAAITGHVHGGNQPIAFATVTLNTAGAAGVGSPGSVIATTTTADDNAGSFSFIKDPTNYTTPTSPYPSTGNTYACPSSGDPLVYLKAVGGNTQNTHDPAVNNTASVFLAPLGRCKEINTSAFLNITEVTTAATVAALQQYIDPAAEVIGADGTGVAYQAITNSFNLISSLVNISTGTAVSSTTFAGGGINLSNGVASTVPATVPATPVSVTATPESAKINTIANILAACVNTTSNTSTTCHSLFTSATPPAYSVTARPYNGNVPFSPATDVLQAAYFMFTNPTNGSTTNLATLYNLPSGVLPFTPTLTAIPTDWTVGITYSSASTCGTNAGSFIGSPVSLSIDTNGNLWVGNSQSGSGNLSQITSTGTPVVCLALNATGATNAPVGTTIDQPTAGYNIWQGAAGSLVLSRYTPSSLAKVNFTLTEAPIALAADGIGNIYYSTSLGNLYQIPNGANVTAANAPSVVPLLISINPGVTPIGLFVDNVTTTPQTGGIWMTSNAGSISRTVPTTLTSDPGYLNGFTTTTFTPPSPTYGITTTGVSNGTNNVLTSISGTSNMVANLTGSGTSYSSASTWPTTAGLGGLSDPTGIAIDGRANIWTANNFGSTLSEISAAKNALSPSTGFQKSSTYLTSSRSIIIDQSGNVWVGGDGNNFVTEIVGAAVPVFQPYANGLSSGRFQGIP